MCSADSVARRQLAFRARDGVELFGVSIGCGRLLVLLHGGGADRHSLVPLALRLAARATVVLPDVRGYGRSICRDPKRHTWQTYAEDVVALLDHLGAERAMVGGVGMGAGIALRAGLSWPERVSDLVLISPEHRGEERPTAELGALYGAFRFGAHAQNVRNGRIRPEVSATLVRAHARPAVVSAVADSHEKRVKVGTGPTRT
jgi:3-oxoadipate enol-lactonase